MKTYTPIDMSYFDNAPVTGGVRQKIPASAEATFKSFEDPDAWPYWIDQISKVKWTTSKPFGVGTTRDIFLGTKKVSEYFIEWQDNERMSFYFARGEVPLFKAFAEDYRLIPDGPNACEVVWRFAFELSGPLKLAHGMAGKMATRRAQGWFAQLAVYMAERKEQYQ